MAKDLTRSVRRFGAAVLVGLCVVGAVTMAAHAQDAASIKPPMPIKEDDPPYILPMLLMVIILAGCVGANLIPAKRGHQD